MSVVQLAVVRALRGRSADLEVRIRAMTRGAARHVGFGGQRLVRACYRSPLTTAWSTSGPRP
jgi:hypothetical protein